MLKIAAAAAVRAGPTARRLDPLGRWSQHLHRIRAQETLALLGNDGAYPLLRQRMADEDDLSIRSTSDAVAAVRDRPDV